MAYSAVLKLRNTLSRGLRAPCPTKFLSTSTANRDIFTVQDEDEYKQMVIDSPHPVVVDFHASWCGPCRLLTPRLEVAVNATNNQVNLALVDIDEMSDLAMEYGVESVPTVIAFNNGQEVDKFVGLIDEDRLSAFVNQLIKPMEGS